MKPFSFICGCRMATAVSMCAFCNLRSLQRHVSTGWIQRQFKLHNSAASGLTGNQWCRWISYIRPAAISTQHSCKSDEITYYVRRHRPSVYTMSSLDGVRYSGVVQRRTGLDGDATYRPTMRSMHIINRWTQPSTCHLFTAAGYWQQQLLRQLLISDAKDNQYRRYRYFLPTFLR